MPEREHVERKIGTLVVRVVRASRAETFPDSGRYRHRYRVLIKNGHSEFVDPDGVRALVDEEPNIDAAFRLVVGYLKTVAEAPRRTFDIFAPWVDDAARRNRAVLTDLYNELSGIEA